MYEEMEGYCVLHSVHIVCNFVYIMVEFVMTDTFINCRNIHIHMNLCSVTEKDHNVDQYYIMLTVRILV